MGGFALTVNFNHLANDPARNPGRLRKKHIQTGGEVGGNAAQAAARKGHNTAPRRARA